MYRVITDTHHTKAEGGTNVSVPVMPPPPRIPRIPVPHSHFVRQQEDQVSIPINHHPVHDTHQNNWGEGGGGGVRGEFEWWGCGDEIKKQRARRRAETKAENDNE